MQSFIETVQFSYQDIQSKICQNLEELDGSTKFSTDLWERNGGGGGITRVMTLGNILEKAGVNFSAVHGNIDEKLKRFLKTEANHFSATGVSLVIHPNHPFIPIVHMNIRYFELDDNTYYFGGGIDLTPHYISVQEAKYFHQRLKDICDATHPDFYHKFKNWADEYFFIKHRNETRGVGGIFYDRLNANNELKKEDILEFSLNLGENFCNIYTYLVNNNRFRDYNENHKEWQMLRRSRYVEFNLIYDLGTRFGLESNGRVESILMSLPPTANWYYDFQPNKNSAEYDTQQMLKKGTDWINI